MHNGLAIYVMSFVCRNKWTWSAKQNC